MAKSRGPLTAAQVASLAFPIPEAAKMVGVSDRTLRQAVTDGHIRFKRVSGRCTLVLWQDVTRWREERPRRGKTRPRPLHGEIGYVYFMQCGELIKIGYSTNLKQRAKNLGGVVLASYRGSMVEEKAQHMRWGPYWEKREYYRPAPELMAYIDTLRVKVDA